MGCVQSVLTLSLSLVFCLFCGCSKSQSDEANWIVMGTSASVKWRGDRDFPGGTIEESVRATFARIETLLNAHDPKSELSRLAPLSDAEIVERCSPCVRPCYEAAFHLRDQTEGAFNPRWKGHGTMDLGAIAKGFAIDCAVRECQPGRRKGRWRVLIDLGGNLMAMGTDGWRVGVMDGDMFVLAPGEACATSGEYFRGKHIRDGRTRREIETDVHSVTVIHPSSAMLADGLSTVLFILGHDAGENFLKAHYPQARAIWTFASR